MNDSELWPDPRGHTGLCTSKTPWQWLLTVLTVVLMLTLSLEWTNVVFWVEHDSATFSGIVFRDNLKSRFRFALPIYYHLLHTHEKTKSQLELNTTSRQRQIHAWKDFHTFLSCVSPSSFLLFPRKIFKGKKRRRKSKKVESLGCLWVCERCEWGWLLVGWRYVKYYYYTLHYDCSPSSLFLSITQKLEETKNWETRQISLLLLCTGTSSIFSLLCHIQFIYLLSLSSLLFEKLRLNNLCNMQYSTFDFHSRLSPPSFQDVLFILSYHTPTLFHSPTVELEPRVEFK